MINLFLGAVTASLLCFFASVVLAAPAHRRAALRLARAGFSFAGVAISIVVVALHREALVPEKRNA